MSRLLARRAHLLAGRATKRGCDDNSAPEQGSGPRRRPRPRDIAFGHRCAILHRTDGGEPRDLRGAGGDARRTAAGEVSPYARARAGRARESLQRLVRRHRDFGRADGKARRQARRHQRQCLRGRRADDEWRLRPEGLYARSRRHHRHTDPRRRRNDRRQGEVRAFLRLRRELHQRRRPRAQSAPADPFGGRIVLRERRRRRDRRRGPRRRRRPGRLDPGSGGVLRRRWPEADLRPRALYRDHGRRRQHRSYRPDYPDGRRQRAAAGGAGGSGRHRSATVDSRFGRRSTIARRSPRAFPAFGSGCCARVSKRPARCPERFGAGPRGRSRAARPGRRGRGNIGPAARERRHDLDADHSRGHARQHAGATAAA